TRAFSLPLTSISVLPPRSLHDALPICLHGQAGGRGGRSNRRPSPCLFEFRDRVRYRDRAARDVGMENLDHAAVDLEDALALVLRQLEGLDGLPREGGGLGIRREDRVAGADLRRMDQ